MVLQKGGFLVAKTRSNVLPFFLRQDNTIEAFIDHMVVMESTRVLCQGVKLAAKCTERPAINGVTMSCAHNIRTSSVHGVMDHVRCGVQEADFTPINHLAFVIHKNEIGFADVTERDTERVDPEAVGLNWIA